jgi:1-acyl-sn-glycerol-3-phosphate acyltransferase
MRKYVFGLSILLGHIPINRKSRGKAIAALGRAEDAIKAGQSICIAPEGTRSHSGLGEFKRGPFHLAVDSKAEIVPAIITGAAGIWPIGQFMPNAGKIR